MPKKKGLGRDVNKSIEIMDELTGALKNFAHMPLKKGLVSSNVDDDQLVTMVNKASEEAFALINKVEDIKHKIKGVKTIHNSRFAKKIVGNFLQKELNPVGMDTAPSANIDAI
jgi:hypothetical protein